MTSKEELKDIFDILVNLERLSDIHDTQDIKKQKFGVVEKDLDLLEEYRKIEEEIGVDLITLFKALKDGIYINEDGSVYKDCIKSIEHWSDGWGFISNDDYIEVLFKDYGISWALTEEEFYKNIK